ncbi:hypothetical protein Q1695_009761 [Nippostrongylus brasiliensis]|nr:hypothetical protein Q1695_009761 [Nippostrongylus brasiliensis]
MYKLCTINLDECRVAYLEINQNVDGRSSSPHGIQYKMCRDFFSEFSGSGTLVCPLRQLNQLMVVGRADFIPYAPTFQYWTRKQHVSVKTVDRADSLSVAECVRYGIIVWLESHQYYRCGKALIKGPFLSSSAVRAVMIYFDVHCTSLGEIYLRVSPQTVYLSPLEPWQVESTPPRWVFCLPKLGRGQLVGKHTDLPADSGFDSYAQMRAYWKNCYGYDLPLAAPSMFYDVWFNGIRSSFLYPDFCVLSSEPQPIRFRDECGEVQRSLEQFSEALTSGKHTICGELCNFYPADPSAVGIPVFSECSRRKAIPKTRDPVGAIIDSITSRPSTKRLNEVEDSWRCNATKRVADDTPSWHFTQEKSNFPYSYAPPSKDSGSQSKRRRTIDID